MADTDYGVATLKTWRHVVTCVTILLLAFMLFWNARTKHFTENGYTREVLLGHDTPQWVLPAKGK